MKNKINIIYSLVVLSACGCSTMKPLTQQEVAQIGCLHIEQDNSGQLEYKKIGTTIFNNKTDKINDSRLYSRLYANTKKQLGDKGYRIAKDKDQATYTLIIDALETYNYPSETGVEGAGFFIHSVLGINTGVLAESRFAFHLIDNSTGKQRVFKDISRIKNTKIKKAPDSWHGFSENEKNAMLAVLAKEMESIPQEAIQKLGL